MDHSLRRVVVTGIGLLSSIGSGKEEVWNNLLNGKSGIKKINHFDTDEFPCKIGGYISNNENSDNYFDINSHLESKEIKRNDRFIQYGIVAAKMAVEDAGIQNLSEEDKLNTGVIAGSGIGGLETIYNGALTINNSGPRKLSPFFIPSAQYRCENLMTIVPCTSENDMWSCLTRLRGTMTAFEMLVVNSEHDDEPSWARGLDLFKNSASQAPV